MARDTRLDGETEAVVLRSTGAASITGIEAVQSLWSGYGVILRCRLDGPLGSVIVKRVQWPSRRDHPRGWTSDRSHERKVRSYEIETAWYERYAARCGPSCRVPECLAVEQRGDGVVLVLEDLDAAGYAGRRQYVGAAAPVAAELDACLGWLASFHATFLGRAPVGLWETGTYWHLSTRPDELDVLDDRPLKEAAVEIDRRLSASPFQTLVHGDAKVANFCFDAAGEGVAAVDFQYVGGGCGMKDLAYFIGSVLDEDDSERLGPSLVDRYFELLGAALRDVGSVVDADALEADWRALYPFAWTDFHRFLKGWSPGHWKLNSYSERLAREVLESLQTDA